MRFLTMVVLILMLMSFFGIGKALYESDNTQNIYEMTSGMEWNSSQFQLEKTTNITNQSRMNSIRISNMITKFIDTIGYMLMETVKWGAEFGFNHPNINYIFIINLIIWSCILGFLTVPVIILIITIYFLVKMIIDKIKEYKKKKTRKIFRGKSK